MVKKGELVTDKEKMLKGELYNPNLDSVLFEERIRCKNLCFEYNNLLPNKLEQRHELMKKILGKTGKNFFIEQPFWCDYGYNIEIGENFYSNHNLIILDPNKVMFGDNVFIGPNCAFYTAEHPLNFETRNKGVEYAKPIKVGNNVWFGGNSVVLKGVEIGDNAVIGAGSVVTKNVPENTLVAGVPAKIIKII